MFYRNKLVLKKRIIFKIKKGLLCFIYKVMHKVYFESKKCKGCIADIIHFGK